MATPLLNLPTLFQPLAAAPYQLQPLPVGSNAGLVGYVGLYFLPVEQLLAEPVTDGAVITGNLAISGGWVELKVTQNTIKFDESPKSSRGLTTYTTKVSAIRAQTGDEGAVLAAMAGRRCVVMLREASGRLRLVGGRESFLLFRAGAEGSNPAARAGLDLTFTGELTRPAVAYSGTLPLLGGGTLSGAVPVAGTGSVQIFNRRGELVATVAAGKRITIKSGFRVALQIQ